MTRKAWIIVGGVIAAAAIAVAVTIVVTRDGGRGFPYGHGEMMRGFGFAERGFGGGYDWSRAIPWFLLAALLGAGAALAIWQPWRPRPAAAVAGATGPAPATARAQFDEWHRAAHASSSTQSQAPATAVAGERSEWTTAQLEAAAYPAAPPVQSMAPPEALVAEGGPEPDRPTVESKPGEIA